METMESLLLNRCHIRKTRIKDSPEERVRQRCIRRLIDELGYPASLMVIEKKISELPHIQVRHKLPNRRLDLLIYSPQGEPLLLIECKAGALNDRAVRQVLAYNAYIGAKAVALVNGLEEIWVTGDESFSAIPPYLVIMNVPSDVVSTR